ncbi:MAG TPA: twin transmembrane helix small protein [Rhodocyclaceae bacterium]|nr:twin transmembrane helix small protein [Rhodocyclaceae bacterium]
MLKLLIIIMLLGAIVSLFSGLLFLYRDQGNGERTAKALTLRIGLSVAAFLLALAGSYFFG